MAQRFAFGALRDAHQLAIRSIGEAIHSERRGAAIDEHELDEELRELAATTSVDAVVLVTADGHVVGRHLGPPQGTTASLPAADGPAWEIRGSGEALHVIGRSMIGEGSGATTIVVRQRGGATAREIERLRFATMLAALPTLLLAAAASWLLSSRAVQPAREAFERQRAFLADVSHELRTPIAALSAHVEVRLAATAQEDPARASLDAMSRQTALLARLVDDLLVLARSEAAQGLDRTVEASAEEILGAAVDDLAPLAERHGSTIRITRADEGTVLGDPAALQRMLVALIENAIKHGGPGEIRVATEVKPRHVVYVVEDDGPGIADELRAHVLARFARGNTQATGSGLGLAIARGIAKAHGGELSLERAMSGGSRAVIVLPGRR